MNEDKAKKTPALIRFFDKTDFFFSFLWIVWALDMVCMSIVIDYESFCIDIPVFIPIIIAILTVIFAILIKGYCSKDPSDIKRRIVFLTWNCIGPLIYNLIFLFLLETDLYNYSGVFLGGIEQFLFRILNIALAVIFLIIYIIIALVKRHRRNKGIEPRQINHSFVNHFGSIVSLVIIFMLLLVGARSLTSDIAYNIQTKKTEANSQFKDEMDGHLKRIDSAKVEAVSTVKLVEMLSKGEAIENTQKETHLVTTTISQSVLDKGAAELKSFTEKYKLIKDFSLQEGSLYSQFYSDDHTAHFAIPSIYIDENGKSTECTIVCKYNDNWQLVDIYILTDSLTDQTRK